jgi:hypothetical protein
MRGEKTIQEQCQILGVSRSAFYYQPRPKDAGCDLEVLQLVVTVLKEFPFYG